MASGIKADLFVVGATRRAGLRVRLSGSTGIRGNIEPSSTQDTGSWYHSRFQSESSQLNLECFGVSGQ